MIVKIMNLFCLTAARLCRLVYQESKIDEANGSYKLPEWACLGLEIRYSRRMNSFYFNNNKQLKIDFTLEVLEPEENIKTFGGKYINLFPCFFYARNEHNLAV